MKHFLAILVALLTITIFNSCEVKEDRISTFSGIVTYNGTPVQSAEVAIHVSVPEQPVQTAFTDHEGRYEMIAKVDGCYTISGMKGEYYDMWVKCEIIINGYRKTYFSKRNFAIIHGQHHTVNIPLDKW